MNGTPGQANLHFVTSSVSFYFDPIRLYPDNKLVIAREPLMQIMASNTTLSAELQRSGSTEELPVLPEVFETVPKSTSSADLQITEPSEEAPELSKTLEDTKFDVNADNLPPVQENVARFNAAVEQAMQILRSAVRPYLPLDRRPWKQNFLGIDLVNHDGAEKSFNDVGMVLMAAQLVETWGKAVADDLKGKISKRFLYFRPTHQRLTLS